MIRNLVRRFRDILKFYRIKKYGLGYIFLESLILLCHRTNTKFEHCLTQAKDNKIDNYLKKNYPSIIKKYYQY